MSPNHLRCRRFALTCSVFLAVFGPKCGGISMHCDRIKLYGSETNGAYNVKCNLSRSLRKNETVVWTFENCTVISNCDTGGCNNTLGGYYASFLLKYHDYVLYNLQKTGTGPYLFSIHDLGNIVAQSFISTVNVTNFDCTFHPSTTCQCVDAKNVSNHLNQQQSSSEETYVELESTVFIPTTMATDDCEKADYTTARFNTFSNSSFYIFKSTSMKTDSSDKKTISSPEVPMFIYATIILVSVLGFISCFCMCFMGCLFYRRHGRGTFRQQSRYVQHPPVNDIDIELQPSLMRPHDVYLQNGCQDFDDINDMESCSIPHTNLSLDDFENREPCSIRHTYLSLEDSESIESCQIQHTYFSPLGNLENRERTIVEEQVQAVDGKVFDSKTSSSVEGMNNETIAEDEENNDDEDDGGDGSHEVHIPGHVPQLYTNVNRMSQRLSHKTPTAAVQFPSPPPLPSKYEPS